MRVEISNGLKRYLRFPGHIRITDPPFPCRQHFDNAITCHIKVEPGIIIGRQVVACELEHEGGIDVILPEDSEQIG